MLILTRDEGESIIIGKGDVEVVYLGRHKGRAKFGITADRKIPVHRKEIYLLDLQQESSDE